MTNPFGGTGPPPDDPIGLERELTDLGLTAAELDAALLDDVGVNLGVIWEPDEGMVARVTDRVEQRIADREAAAAVLDLLGLGWFTLEALLRGNNEA